MCIRDSYTGKAFGGIVEMARDGRIPKDSKVLLIHTGGTPGIFAQEHVDAKMCIRDRVYHLLIVL